MKDAQKPDHLSLSSLITRLKEGRFVIPDFQRDFEWKPWDVRDLMRSIFLIAAQIYTSINKHGAASRFVKAGPDWILRA